MGLYKGYGPGFSMVGGWFPESDRVGIFERKDFGMMVRAVSPGAWSGTWDMV